MCFFEFAFLEDTAGFEEVVNSERVEGMDPRRRGLVGTFVCCVLVKSTWAASSSPGWKKDLKDPRRFMKAPCRRHMSRYHCSSKGSQVWAAVECAHTVGEVAECDFRFAETNTHGGRYAATRS